MDHQQTHAQCRLDTTSVSHSIHTGGGHGFRGGGVLKATVLAEGIAIGHHFGCTVSHVPPLAISGGNAGGSFLENKHGERLAYRAYMRATGEKGRERVGG